MWEIQFVLDIVFSVAIGVMAFIAWVIYKTDLEVIKAIDDVYEALGIERGDE